MERKPVAAGRFYKGKSNELKKQIRSFLPESSDPQRAIGAIVPHAGYIFSGRLATKTLASVIVPPTIILLGPNHTGLGHRVSLSSADWRIPSGLIGSDNELIDKIVSESSLAKIDETAHAGEHSLEVILPILHQLRNDISIVPITIGPLTIEQCYQLGEKLSQVIAASDKDILLIGSNDMSHMVSRKIAAKLDAKAISHIIKLDPDGLYQTVHSLRISMCGIYPVTTLLVCANNLGATTAFSTGYCDSGDVTGDTENVVGYAGVTIR